MSIRKVLLLLFAFCAVSFSVMAQKDNSVSFKVNTAAGNSQEGGFFNHLDVAVTAGTTGLGFDVATPLGEYARLRTGLSYMPQFEFSSNFRVQVGDSLDKKYDAQGHKLETKFDKLSGYLKDFVGYEVDDEVKMLCTASYFNFKLLVDVFPFPNKNWHVTAGFFAGPSEIAKAVNATEEMPSLLSVSMWNTIYDKVWNYEPIFGGIYLPPEIEDKVIKYGKMGFHAGNYVDDVKDDAGNIVHKKGDKYMMVPDTKEGTVKASIKTNRFKPYVGFGYGGAISKDKLTRLSFDAGVMFWGGSPSVITHDGTDLVRDVEDVRGKLGRYVDTAKFFKVFPMLEIRLSRRIF